MKFLIVLLSVANLAPSQEQNSIIPWWYMAARPVAIASIRTPIDAVTQNQQVYNTSLFQTVKQLSKSGLSTFYRGLLPRLISESTRSIYMLPAWTYSQSLFHNFDPELSKEFPYLRKLFAGCVFGACEAIIVTPMSRVSVLLNTQSNSFSWSTLKYFEKKDFYRGAGLSFFNSSFGCTVYLMSDRMIRQTIKNYRDNTPLNSYDYVLAGISTSFIYSGITGPLVTLMTRVQHTLPSQSQSTWTVFKAMIRQNKISVLFAGWPLRFLQLTLFTTIESVFLDRIDQNLD
ncbi:MAG: hypothetical protein KF820_01210 [Candidatus Paracaedibacteraceae bacterium]|nr:hypothetical protein [Candidatus Paracaedibacteraceae bacterium]